MKLSLATRNFLGYAVVLLTFGAVSIFSVSEMHRNQQEIRLVSQGYMQLSQDAAAIDTFFANQLKDTERLADEKAPETRRALIRLARVYFPPLMLQRLTTGEDKARAAIALAPSSEETFVREIADRFARVKGRYRDYSVAAEALFHVLEERDPSPQRIEALMAELRQQEAAVGNDIRYLHASLESRIRDRVNQAAARERRTGLAIIALSVLAVGVGLLATFISARALRPVATLIEGVSRIGRGDYSAQLGVRGDDEISVLAREFDKMARSLQEREGQLKEKQDALIRAEQLAAVGRISAQVTHEIRNPLSSIGLNVELLDEAFAKARFEAPEEAREAKEILAAVTREVDRLTEVTEHYLKMARLPSPSLVREDVTDLLGHVLEFSREELERAQVKVVQELDPGTPPALADPAQLRQVFLNLLRNSREAMSGQGGRLTVAARPVDGQIEVVFSDTGRGMPNEVKDRIFEPFFSTKEGGTGLGLAVSQQILQAHGGSIQCQSTPGQGTTFVIRLPRA
jgi:signal transduction histidine kinase